MYKTWGRACATATSKTGPDWMGSLLYSVQEAKSCTCKSNLISNYKVSFSSRAIDYIYTHAVASCSFSTVIICNQHDMTEGHGCTFMLKWLRTHHACS